MKKFFIYTVLFSIAMSLPSCDGTKSNELTFAKVKWDMQSLTETEQPVVETEQPVIETEQPVIETLLPVNITDYEFFELFDDAVNKALGKISLMQKSGMKKLGEEIQYGDVSGTVHYKANFNAWKRKATVVITFNNYCDTIIEDQRIMVLNNAVTISVNIRGNGELSGIINISGFYPGYVDHNLDISSQENSGGNYNVFQTESEGSTSIPWNYSY